MADMPVESSVGAVVRSHHMSRGRGRRAVLSLVAVSAAFLAAAPAVHAGDDDDVDLLNPGWSDRVGNSIKSGMERTTKMMGFGKPQAPPPAEAPSGCPTIAVLDGTQSQRVMATGANDNQGVRYQYSLFNVGRQCSIAGGRISLKVGAGGRVLLGPAGAAGHFDIPIRVVVFSEVSQKPVESKLYRVSAAVQAGQTGAPFQFVSDSLVVPLAAGQTGADYSIKVGFDAKGTDAAKPAKAKRGHRKPIESAAAASQ